MKPASIAELQEQVVSSPCLTLHGAGTKPGLHLYQNGVTILDTSGLTGVITYQPEEFTFTALAGTRLAEIAKLLEQHGQYLPFDPPLVERGATLGGTVAAGLSGPGRYRYGGVRDFLMGVRFVDGQGRLVSAGGKVVKNSAGFDLPKLMVGSLGQYGALVEVTFKVFPRPPAYATLKASYLSIEQALESLYRITTAPLDLFAVELVPGNAGLELWVRLAGRAEALPERLERVRGVLGGGEVLDDRSEHGVWRAAREFTWLAEGASLVKLPITPGTVLALDRMLAEHGAVRRYSVGCNLAWVGWPAPIELLDHLLRDFPGVSLSGLLVLGQGGQPRLGARTGAYFARRVKLALDPQGRWLGD